MSETQPSPDSAVRRAQRVLSMVGELHKRGFQLLRVSPGMSPSGMHWRCIITPAENTLPNHGALIADHDEQLIAGYSSAQKNEYFGWTDTRNATARQLATRFTERFPTIVERSRGEDWEYAGWFVQMLGVAETGHLPIAYSDDWFGEDPPRVLHTLSSDGPPDRVTVPLPPIHRRT